MTSVLPKSQDLPLVATGRPLSWWAQRNLARQIDEMVAAGHVAMIRQLITDDLTRARVVGAIGLCTDVTRQLLAANSMLRAIASDPYEHAMVTRGLAFAEATAQQIVASAYA